MTTRHSTQLGPIVVGISEPPTGHRQALTWAVREAALQGTSLLLVHAAGRDLVVGPTRPGEDVGRVLDQARAAAQRALESAAAQARRLDPDIVVDVAVSLDASCPAVQNATVAPAMVVVGRRSGRHEPSTLDDLEPSLAHGLDCPLVEVGDAAADGGLLVLADGSVWSVPTLTTAFEHADRHGLSVTVAHVLADPWPEEPAQDLHLMDETARIEAASGPSTLGLQRTLLQQQVRLLCDRFPDVAVQTVDLGSEVDGLLDEVAGRTACLVSDSAHLRRLAEVTLREGGRWVTMIVPSNRPDHAPDAPASRTAIRTAEADLDLNLDLEAWWRAPTVDEPRRPVLARVRRRLRARPDRRSAS